MFLAFIANQLGFLELSDESGVFLEFPLETRKVLAREVVGVFIKGIKPSVLSSPIHVKCAMEIIGQGFGLPIAGDTVDIISSATEIYRRWLFEESPPPIKRDNDQLFIREIFNHLSLLFHIQPGEEKDMAQDSETLLSHHTNLCTAVLDIFCKAARDIPLNGESWEHLLKVLLGITDSLLNTPKGDDHLSRNLCPTLLKTLFEIWLRSKTMGVMWQNLRDLIWHWRHRMPTIQIWNDVCSAMMNRVLRILYGTSCGTERITLFDAAEIDAEDQYVFYAWYRLLHLLGDLETIPLPDNYLEALKGIGRLAQQLLTVGDKRISAMGSGVTQQPLPPAAGGSPSVGGPARASVTFRERGARRAATPGMPVRFSDDEESSESLSSSGGASGKSADIGSLRAPDGNTILHILGPFLFDAINIYREGFEKGKSKALEVVCSIFLRKPNTKFDDTYLSYFYRGLEHAVLYGHPMYVSTILLNTMDFFQMQFKGANILIPSFLLALKLVLPVSTPFESEGGGSASSGAHIPANVLRRAAIKLLGNLICLGAHYDSVQFQRRPTDKRTAQQVVKSYDMLNLQLNELILGALQTETDPLNLQSLLWTAFVFIQETVESNKAFVIEFIKLVQRRVLLSGSASWGDQVSFTALQALTEIACLFDYVRDEMFAGSDNAGGPNPQPKSSHAPTDKLEVISVTSTVHANMGSALISTLCKFYEVHCSASASPTPPLDDLIVQCLQCMQAWVMKGEWIFNSPHSLKLLLGVLDKSKGDVKGYHAPTDKIKEAAVSLLLSLINQHRQFPPPTGPSNLSALPTEAELLTYTKEPVKNVTCFIFNKTLITIIRHARARGEIAATIVLRDNTGRYVWNTKMNYFPADTVIPHEEEVKSPEKDPLSALPPPEEIDYLQSLFGFLDEASAKEHNMLLSLCKKRIQDEAVVLRKTRFGDCNTRARRPELPPVSDENDCTPTRLFLSHLGLLSLGNRSSFHLLQVDPAKPFNFMQNFNTLDQARERECFKVGIVYIKEGMTNMADILETDAGSKEFLHFISNVGWTVDLRTHTGFMGDLEHGTHGNAAPYFADLTSEVIFHVNTLMPNGREKGQPQKAKLIHSDKVLVSWVENLDEYDSRSENTKAVLNIIINPILGTQLYRIRIGQFSNTNRKLRDLGPLQDGMVVSKHVLPLQVRQTAMLASRIVSEESKPLTMRRLLIDDFTRRYKVDVPVSKFYSTLFPLSVKK